MRCGMEEERQHQEGSRTYVWIAHDLHAREIVSSQIRPGSDGHRRLRCDVLRRGHQDAVAGKRRVRRLVLLFDRGAIQRRRVHPQRARRRARELEAVGRVHVHRRRRRARAAVLLLLRALLRNSREERDGARRRVGVAVRALAPVVLRLRRRVLGRAGGRRRPSCRQLGVDEATPFAVRARPRDPERL